MENPFKDAQIVSVPSNHAATDLVYIDDEEEEPRSTAAIQIELRNEEPKRSSTPVNGDISDNEHPLSIKVNPINDDDDQIMSTPEDLDKQETRTCEIIPSNGLLDIKEPDEDCTIEDQEQFEIVENAEKDTSSSSTNDSTRANKSNESNDHSYSQPHAKEASNTFCDDIVKNILLDSKLENNKNALTLLKDYTKFIENFIFKEDQYSQLPLCLNQMLVSLENGEKNFLDKNSAAGDANIPNGSRVNSPILEAINEQVEQDSAIVENAETKVDEISIKSEVKVEAMEIETGTILEHKSDVIKIDTIKDMAAEENKLKVYVKKAQEKTADFSERNQKLLESVFVTDEDVENANSKFKSSLSDFISFHVALLMDVENKSNSDATVDEEIKKIKDKVSMSQKRMSRESYLSSDEKHIQSRKSSTDTAIPSTSENDTVKVPRKSSINSATHNSSDSDSDSSIKRLTNLKTLEQKSRKYDKPENSQEKLPKKTRKTKKKSKENSDDSSSLSSCLSSESETEETPSKKDEKESDDATSEDEELKWKQKLEMKARNMLLASSDDEESYVTSESEFVSDNEKQEKVFKKKARKRLLSSSDESGDEKVEPEESKKSINNSMDVENDVVPVALNDTSVSQDDNPQEESKITQNGEEDKKAKKRQRTSFEREVFNKSLLADSEDEKSSESDGETSQAPKKQKKDAKKSDVVDLTQNINIQADRMAPTLEKYLEKISSVEGDVSPKKEPSKSKAPSPVVDDIDCISISSESDSEISSTVSEGQTRRRKQLTEEELKEETKKAKRDESERVKKLEAKEHRMTQYLTQRLSQCDLVSADELVLDFCEEKDLTIEVHPNLVAKLKDHQIDGIKFMYNNCYGSLEDVKENNGSGCILAHCMGLGKTLQLIVLLHTVIRYPELYTKRILIICPKSTIHNWAEEFRKWLKDVDNKPGVYYLEDNIKIEKRIEKLREWYESKKPSVFLINYESFRILANWSESKRGKIALPEETIKKYKAQLNKYLLEPGPHLVVCDEGHIIKNQKGATNRAITKITTKRRVILTGTPVQNALHEYYAMVEWIKPNILGTIHEFNNIYANPIKDGQNKDSSDYQIKKMKQKSYVLNKNLSKFVQRKDAQVLKEFLPKKYEYCISVPLTKKQEELYNTFLQANRSDEMGKSLLPIYTALRKIWTHPVVLQYAYERARRGENKFSKPKEKEKKSQNAFNEEEGDEPDDIFDTSQGTTAVTNNWWNNMLTDQDMYSITSSHKMILLFEILRLCEMKKEKVLIFSSFVAVLDIIERFMKAIHNQDKNPNASVFGLDKFKTTWELGKDYFRLDGSTPRNVRQEMINLFNNTQSPRLRCFLISAKAGGQGINLVAANRCIIVDTSWNPANDNQNIFRIFRLGQKRTCYVYRLVACATMEERVYSRSVTKEAMSHRVVEKKQVDRHYVRTELEELFFPYELKPLEKTPSFPKDDDILRYLLHAHPTSAYTYHEHDSLLENKPDQELNEDEKKEAWNVYLSELQGNRYTMQNMNNNPNMNNMVAAAQGMGIFGKNQMTQDFVKMYNDMIGSSNTNYPQLMNLLPSTSLTGNMTVSGAPTTSYNANNIPPASNSIFAPPASTSNNQSLVMPYASTSGLTNTATQKKKTSKMGHLASLIKDNKGRYVPPKGPITAAPKRLDALMIPPNSSENLSILPDDEHHKSPPSQQALSKSFAGTSARTHQVLPKRVDRIVTTAINNNNLNKNVGMVLDKSGRSLIRPNVIMTKSNDPKNQVTVQKLTVQSPVVQKVQNPQGSVIQRSQSFVSQSGNKNGSPDSRLVTNLVNQAKAAQLKSNVLPANQPKVVRKMVKNKPTTKVINLGSTATNDSVSIIKLPPKTIAQQQAPNKSTLIGLGPATPSQLILQNNNNAPKFLQLNPQDPSKVIQLAKNPASSNMAKIIKQQEKRIIDNRTNQTLKRIRMNDSTGLAQSQNLPSQQSTSPRVILPTTSQRINSQIGSQSAASTALNAPQFIQIRGPQKSSQQQPNKNQTTTPMPAEIVELE